MACCSLLKKSPVLLTSNLIAKAGMQPIEQNVTIQPSTFAHTGQVQSLQEMGLYWITVKIRMIPIRKGDTNLRQMRKNIGVWIPIIFDTSSQRRLDPNIQQRAITSKKAMIINDTIAVQLSSNVKIQMPPCMRLGIPSMAVNRHSTNTKYSFLLKYLKIQVLQASVNVVLTTSIMAN